MPSYYKSARKFYKKNVRKPYRKFAKSNPALATAMVEGLKGAALIALKSKIGMNAETRYVDTLSTAYSCTASLALSTHNLITPIPQGDANGTRQGSSIRMTSYSIKGFVYNPPTNLISSQVRIICVNWGRSSNNDAASQVLQVQNDVLSFRNLDATVPFKILSDKTYMVEPNSTGDAKQIVKFQWTYTPKNHHIAWTDADTAGTQANCINGLIGVYIMAHTFTAGQAPSLTFSQRVKYVDN